MKEITVLAILEVFLDSVIKHWVLIVGIGGATITGLKYLSNRSKQQQKNNDLLAGILKSSESMDSTVKEMSSQISNMNLEFRDLRKDHDHLADSHDELKKEVAYIKRGK